MKKFFQTHPPIGFSSNLIWTCLNPELGVVVLVLCNTLELLAKLEKTESNIAPSKVKVD
jgi:hypothetical protein